MPKASISAFCHHEQQEGREELGREHTATGEGKVAGAPNGIRDFSIRRCNDLINFTCTREVGTIFCRRRELDLAHIRFFLFDRESQRHCLIEACAHYTWVHVCSHARALQKRHALRSAPPVFGPSDCATKAAETTARSPGRAQLDAKERAHTRSGSLSPLLRCTPTANPRFTSSVTRGLRETSVPFHRAPRFRWNGTAVASQVFGGMAPAPMASRFALAQRKGPG